MKKSLILPITIILTAIFSFESCKKDCDNIIFNNTSDYGSFTDNRDGNVYRTITIGSQTWMAENLRYVSGQQASDPVTCAVYGELYGEKYFKTVCPEGWHTPSKEEWETLVNYLGGMETAGGKLKEAGTAHWKEPNTGATNESGFSALPAGGYDGNSGGFGRGETAIFWTTTKEGGIYRLFRLDYNSTAAQFDYEGNPDCYVSVRCIKDK